MPEIPQIVRERLASSKDRLSNVKTSQPGANHPDPNVLAAFSERLLPAGERAVVFEHLARCSDCRDIIALALPEIETAVATNLAPARTTWFSGPAMRWALVAAGVIVVASVGVMEIRQHPSASVAVESKNASPPAAVPANQPLSDGEGTSQQQAKDEKPAAPTSNGKLADKATARPTEPNVPRSAPALATNALSSNARGDIRAGRNVFHGSADLQKTFGWNAANADSTEKTNAEGGSTAYSATLGGPIQKNGAGELSPAAALKPHLDAASPAAKTVDSDAANAQPVSPPPVQQSAGTTASEALEVQSQAENIQVSAQNTTLDQQAQNQQINDLPVQGRVISQQQDLTRASAPAAPVVGGMARTRSPLWSVTSAGNLQRSFDGGRSWQNVNVGDNAMITSMFANAANSSSLAKAKEAEEKDKPAAAKAPRDEKADNKTDNEEARKKAARALVFRAVSAMSSEVWAGGLAGVLYHSPDAGGHWIRVIPATPNTQLTSDIVTVELPSPQYVKIATSNSEVWTTNDDGRTWQKQ
jgi:hypothetical protein